jgi:hypothetical protein
MMLLFFFIFFFLKECAGEYKNPYDMKNFYPKDLDYFSPTCEKAHENIFVGVVNFQYLEKKEKDVIELMLYTAYYGTPESKKNSDRFYRGDPPEDYFKWKCYTKDRRKFLNRIIGLSFLFVFISALFLSMYAILYIIIKIISFILLNFFKLIPA